MRFLLHISINPTDASSGAASSRWPISRCGVFPAAGEIKAEAYRVSRLGPIQLGRPGQRVCRAVIRSRHGGAGATSVEGIVETKCGVAGRRGGGETTLSLGGKQSRGGIM